MPGGRQCSSSAAAKLGGEQNAKAGPGVEGKAFDPRVRTFALPHPTSATLAGVGELAPHALALALSAIGIGLALVALTRSVPARLREETETALHAARDASDRVDRMTATWEAAKADYGTILDAVSLERETIQRHRAKLSAAQSREGGGAPPGPQSRDEMLAGLRVEAGMTNTGG